jgi:hypothetical protein
VKYVEETGAPAVAEEVAAATVLQPIDNGAEFDEAAATVLAGAPIAEGDDIETMITSTPSTDYGRFTVPGHRVSFEMPLSGWRPIGGGATTLAVLAHSSNDAALAVERAQRPEGVAGSASALANAESKAIRESNPAVSKIDATSFDDHLYTSAILNYTRPTTRGPERVFQFSCVDGPALYRLTCSATMGRFDEFEPVFTRAAATFDAGSTE